MAVCSHLRDAHPSRAQLVDWHHCQLVTTEKPKFTLGRWTDELEWVDRFARCFLADSVIEVKVPEKTGNLLDFHRSSSKKKALLISCQTSRLSKTHQNHGISAIVGTGRFPINDGRWHVESPWHIDPYAYMCLWWSGFIFLSAHSTSFDHQPLPTGNHVIMIITITKEEAMSNNTIVDDGRRPSANTPWTTNSKHRGPCLWRGITLLACWKGHNLLLLFDQPAPAVERFGEYNNKAINHLTARPQMAIGR
jgi:hypothetical protein